MWRFEKKIVVTPRSASALAVSSLVSPAPTTSTLRSGRWPTTCAASATATEDTEACPAPISVSERTRLPVRSAAEKSRFVSGPVVPAASAAS